MIAHTIFFVHDQKRSAELYSRLLGSAPTLDVPGMTEFRLSSEHVLGIMPQAGIRRILGLPASESDESMRRPDPSQDHPAPKAELYLLVEDPGSFLMRARELGLKELSPLQPRNWGDRAGYVMDLDGNILAFASKIGQSPEA